MTMMQTQMKPVDPAKFPRFVDYLAEVLGRRDWFVGRPRPARCPGRLAISQERYRALEAQWRDAQPPPPPYIIGQARYAKGQMTVRCESENGFKTRAARLIGDGLKCRWSGRERAYIATPSKVAKFEALFAAGFDACVITGSIDHRERQLRGLTVPEAMKALQVRAEVIDLAERRRCLRGNA
jgi:hypothetical protein